VREAEENRMFLADVVRPRERGAHDDRVDVLIALTLSAAESVQALRAITDELT
jgi:hypothetical protein